MRLEKGEGQISLQSPARLKAGKAGRACIKKKPISGERQLMGFWALLRAMYGELWAAAKGGVSKLKTLFLDEAFWTKYLSRDGS